jgi:predicted permease
VETILQDVRYAFRAFVRTPGFTAVALLTLATAIGANSAVFSFVNALLLSPPAGVSDPGTLVSVYTSDFSSGPYGATSLPDYDSLKADARAFATLSAFREDGATLVRVGEAAERVRTMAVSGEFFNMLGVQPFAGRLIAPSDAVPSQAAVAVIGHALWQRAFGGNPAAVGAVLTANGTPYTVIGIAPAEFTGLSLGAAFDLWTPLIPTGSPERGNRSLSVVGRLSPGADLRQAQAQLDGIAAALAAEFPATNRGTLAAPDRPRPMIVVRHTRMHPSFRGQVTMIAGVLLAAVALVLLIACANVAGLLLSRATARQREMAVRLAIGASRQRLVRQMLTESLILGIAGGALGLLVALWTADVLPSFFPADQAQLLDARIDRRVFGFTAAIALISGIVFGLAPALQGLRASAAAALRTDAARSGDVRGGVRLRKALVTGQVAVASVLLVSSILLTRSLWNALNADLGFSTKQAVLSSLELPAHLSEAAARSYFDSAAEAVGRIPGVEETAFARWLPVAGISRRGFTVEGSVRRPGEGREFHYNIVSHNYFSAMGITPIQGRGFEESDRGGRPVAVVNHIFANRFYGGNAVGRHIRDSRDLDLEIVGVVRADRRLDLQDASLPVVFYLWDQQFSSRMMLVARTSTDAHRLADTVRRSLAGINRDVAVFRTVTLEEHLGEALAANRLIVALVATCGVMALALALIGVYGIVSYTVARRTREIGVRVALGATPGQVLRLLLAEQSGIVGFGLITGLAAAFGAARLLGSMLYGVSAFNPAAYALVLVIVGVVAATAGMLPARRALRVNPVTALRQD